MYNLPEQFSEFSEARQAGFLAVKDVKEAGGKVAGIFCTYTPVEILNAAGFTDVSLCGMSAETIPDAEVHLPKNLCPLVKSSYGFAVSDKCPYTYFSDLIVGETTCDGKKKMYELLGQLKPVYILRLPQGFDRNARQEWRNELKLFIKYIEEKFNLKITDEALREAVRMKNRERREKLKLLEMFKLSPPPAYGYELYKLFDGAGFLFNREERITKLTELRESLEKAYAAGETTVPKNAKRIMVTGCPIGGVLDKTVKLIEENGGTVVCFENCSGIKAAYQMVDEDAEDIVDAIADRYLDIGCSVMTPNNVRAQLLDKLVKEFNIEGVVEINLQTCLTYIIEAHSVRKQMQDLNVPYICIETDYSESDYGQLSTRIEAFLERL